MICPRCKSKTRVLDTRKTEDEKLVRRIRECTKCRYKLTTFEILVSNEKAKELREKHRLEN